jgi:SAM-dependent methyltransferase
LPPVVTDAIGSLKTPRSSKIPWSPGWLISRHQLYDEAIRNEAVLACFRRKEPLPPGYGIGLDERCVEYPWVISRLLDTRSDTSKQIWLDAGSTLNQKFVLDHDALKGAQIHILTLAPERDCFWLKGISYLFGDLRDIPIKDAYYDCIVCASTLEHIGLDNARMTGINAYSENRPNDFSVAMREMARVLKPGGQLLLTVPFGRYENFGEHQVFDRTLLTRAIQQFGEARTVQEEFYRYSPGGWTAATWQECADCEYVEWIARVWQSKRPIPRPVPVEPDLAAAARAVACVRFVK